MAENNAKWVEQTLKTIDINHMHDFTSFLSKARSLLD